MIKKILKSNEFITFSVIVLLSAVIGSRNPAFFSLATVFDILRGSIVISLMAFGVLLVIISGNVDVSFVAMAALASYGTHTFLLSQGYQGGAWLYFLIACPIGMAAGLLNGFLVTRFNLPAFNVSLATYTFWYGFIRFFIGSKRSFTLPDGAANFYNQFLVKVKDPFVGDSGLHFSVLFVLVIGILTHILLKYTTLGRGIYAMGGNREVAVRSGFNVKSIMMIILMIMGGLSAFAGITHSFLSRFFDPTMFLSQNLDVISAVIIGGASITGGRGSIPGTFMGVILVQLIHRSMILTGIPTEWQDLMVGVLLVLFISVPFIKNFIKNQTETHADRTLSEKEEPHHEDLHG